MTSERDTLRITSDGRNVDEAVRDGMLVMFLRNQPLVLMSNCVVAPIYALAIWFTTGNAKVSWWVAAVIALSIARFLIFRQLRKASDANEWPTWSLGGLIGGSLVAGLSWGAGAVLFTVSSDVIVVGVSSFFAAGMISGATVAMAPLLAAYLCFAAPFVIPFAITVLMDGSPVQIAMAVSLFFYVGAMFAVTWKFHMQIREALTLRWTNNALLTEVMAEKDRAETASRVKSDFLARMSHELRTPLNSIIGFSETIISGRYRAGGLERYEEFAREIHVSGRHLLDLIEDILDIAKIEAGTLEMANQIVDLANVVDFAVSLHARQAETEGVSLEVVVPGRGVSLRANERALRQILINLISNAVKFTPSGGRVQISAYRRAGQGIELVVGDTGIGIPEEKIDLVTQPFSQLETAITRKYEGSGLGLAIVTSLINWYGGDFELRSREGAGTTVTVRFPETLVIGPESGDATMEPADPSD